MIRGLGVAEAPLYQCDVAERLPHERMIRAELDRQHIAGVLKRG